MSNKEKIINRIKENPFLWWGEKRITSPFLEYIYDKFSYPKISKKHWSIVPYFTAGRFGRSWSLHEENFNDLLSVNVFTGDNYERKEVNYIYVDASFSFVFYYKNQPAFYMSFLFDNDKNLYVRQIQGFPESSIHNKIGKDWKKSAIYYLSKVFKKCNNIYLIHEKSVSESIIKLYSEYYDNELHDPIIKRVEKNYKKLRESICFKTISINKNSVGGEYSTKVFADTFFKINKQKLKNK